MPKLLKTIKFLILIIIFYGGALFSLIAGVYIYLSPQLPSVSSLKDIQFQIPLRIYSQDKKLIAEFGEKRRKPILYEDIPRSFINAAIAAEDQSFFEHSGVDIKGLTRAVKLLIQNKGAIRGGGSTITMQLAKVIFLSNEQTFTRKFNQIILALQIENELSKEEILELYFNVNFLGKRAYGVQAAAFVYYGKTIDQLTLAEQAMIAGIPKAPTTFNPINNPDRALIRRNWILGRMLALQFIDTEQFEESSSEPITASYHGLSPEIEAPYVAEMIRKDIVAKFGESAYTEGIKVISTINGNHQVAANNGVRNGIHSYNERHGYKGHLGKVELPALEPKPDIAIDNYNKDISKAETSNEAISNNEIITEPNDKSESIDPAIQAYQDSLKPFAESTILRAALVTEVLEESATLTLKNGTTTTLTPENVLWAKPYIDINTTGEQASSISEILHRGDIVYIRQLKNLDWRLAQKPSVQGALLALNPEDGAVIAMVGGYEHQQSKYNRTTQGGRQAGSTFKPFIYTAALENGFTAASIINDAPVVFNDEALEGAWRPENSGGKFHGPTRLRQALYRSRNLVSIRVLRKLGISTAIQSAQRFGLKPETLPHNLSLALGSANITPYQVATAFSSFANGGYKIEPYYIKEIRNNDDEILFKARPITVCKDCEPAEQSEQTESLDNSSLEKNKALSNSSHDALNSTSETKPTNIEEDLTNPDIPLPLAISNIEPRVNYIMNSILADVIKKGTGRRALALGRNDIRGKTGTTNDQIDAWFTGFNNRIVATSWVGFDQPSTLGRGEYGATAALPIWLEFMQDALKNTPEEQPARPDQLVTMRINAKTGEPAYPGDKDVIFEVFRSEHAPKRDANASKKLLTTGEEEVEPEQLF